MTVAAKPAWTITGRHVLVGMILFFGVIFVIDGMFIATAYRTFSGQVASNPYEAGLAFNQTLEQRRREAALGWKATVDTPDAGVVAVRMVDKAGAPLSALSMTGVLERPATEVGRQTLVFKPAGDGWYRAAARLDGAWDLSASARNAQESFEIETRLVAP